MPNLTQKLRQMMAEVEQIRRSLYSGNLSALTRFTIEPETDKFSQAEQLPPLDMESIVCSVKRSY